MLLYGEHKQEQLISWVVWNHGGEEALKLGLGYVVGNGQDIAVWSNPWLSSTEVATPIGPITLSAQHLKVDDLLDHSTNSWDLTKIRQELPLYEETIRQIIPSSLQPPDKRVRLGGEEWNLFHQVRVPVDEEESPPHWRLGNKLDEADLGGPYTT